MTNNLKEFFTRSVSGLIYAAVMIASITVHPLCFFVVFLFILITGMVEFYKMSKQTGYHPMVLPGIMAEQ